jgi:hypothetical protein
MVSLPELVSSALHVEASPASGFHRFALMQINRQSLIGRNVLMRNVRLFEERVTLQQAGSQPSS